MNKKSIFIYSQEFLSSNNGAISGLILYINALKQIPDYEVIIIYNSKFKKKFNRKKLGIKFIGLDHFKIFNSQIPIKIKETIKFRENDIIIFNSIYSLGNYILSKLAIKNKVNYFVISHGGYLEKNYKKSFIKKKIANLLIEKSFLIKAKFVINHFNQESIDIKNYISTRIKTIAIPFPLNSFINYKSYIKEDTIIYFGRTDIFHKGIDIFLKSLLYSKYINNFKVRLYLQKSNKADFEIIMRECKKIKSKYKINIKAQNEISGEKKNLILQKSRIALFPSRYEGFGISLIEALSNNIICLVSDKHQIMNILKKTNTAHILKNKAEYFGKKIDDIFLGKSIALNDKNILFQIFDEKIILKKFIKIFNI